MALFALDICWLAAIILGTALTAATLALVIWILTSRALAIRVAGTLAEAK
jgi:hypothetical protein